MKKVVFILTFMFGLGFHVSAQDTVFGLFPNYFYNWDYYMESGTSHDSIYCCLSDWYLDSRPCVLKDDSVFVAHVGQDFNLLDFINDTQFIPTEIAIQMHPDMPLNVSGMAIPFLFDVIKDINLESNKTLGLLCDTCGMNDITLHLNVYDKNMGLTYSQAYNFGESQTARYIEGFLTFNVGDDLQDTNSFFPYFMPFCDFFFDTVLTLTDTFYISFTLTYNDGLLYRTAGFQRERHTSYAHLGILTRRFPYEKRLFRGLYHGDTWLDVETYGWHFSLMFPIIERDCDTCPQVRNIEVFKGSPTQFFMRWDAGTNHLGWQVSYGPAGTAPEDGTLVDCAAHQSPIITVDPDSHYVAYVRARCRFARDVWGDWSDPVSIWLNDPGDGIGTAAEPAVTLTPNPAGDRVAIAAEGGVTLVEAFAENGACAYRIENPAATIDISRWTPGTYILRIHTPQGVATRKLVVAR